MGEYIRRILPSLQSLCSERRFRGIWASEHGYDEQHGEDLIAQHQGRPRAPQPVQGQAWRLPLPPQPALGGPGSLHVRVGQAGAEQGWRNLIHIRLQPAASQRAEP